VKRPGYMMKLGTFIKAIMTKFWIWVVAIMLFVIGLGGEKVVLYRIVYMALFLIFILTFQVGWMSYESDLRNVRLCAVGTQGAVPSDSDSPIIALVRALEEDDVWVLADGNCLLNARPRHDLHLPVRGHSAVSLQLHGDPKTTVCTSSDSSLLSL
jgi:hypothetical protein